MPNLFTEHPHKMGETYWQHLYEGLSFGCKMLFAGIACVIHAVFPFLFQKTGSDILFKIITCFVKRNPTIDQRTAALLQTLNEKTTKQKGHN